LQPGNSLVKFADDTYLVVPSVNASMRQQEMEMDNIATWAAPNNFKLNVSKSIGALTLVKHSSSRRRIAETLPQPLPDISRENVLKILGVTITNHLSATQRQNISVELSVTARNRCTGTRLACCDTMV